jgi:hypothetical protein
VGIRAITRSVLGKTGEKSEGVTDERLKGIEPKMVELIMNEVINIESKMVVLIMNEVIIEPKMVELIMNEVIIEFKKVELMNELIYRTQKWWNPS